MGKCVCRSVGKGRQPWGPVGREGSLELWGGCHIFSSLEIPALVWKAPPNPGLLAGAWRFRESYSECCRLDKKDTQAASGSAEVEEQ